MIERRMEKRSVLPARLFGRLSNYLKCAPHFFECSFPFLRLRGGKNDGVLNDLV